MTPEEALAACEASVRNSDPDRFFATLFAPADKRPCLFALYAFNHEIARAAEMVREPMMAEIRLQWWREAIEEARDGRPRKQPVAIGLSELFKHTGLSAGALEELIDARAAEITSAPFADVAALEAQADSTSGGLMRAAALVLDSGAEVAELTREAGTAYAMAGILRAIPFHAARGKCFLPADLLAAEGLSTNDALSARKVELVRPVISKLADAAMDHFRRARHLRIPRRVMPAEFSPAALVPAYLSHVTRRNRDVLRDTSDVSLLRRQLILLRSATLGRL